MIYSMIYNPLILIINAHMSTHTHTLGFCLTSLFSVVNTSCCYLLLLLGAHYFLASKNQLHTLPANPLVSLSLILRALFAEYSVANLCDFQCLLYPKHTEIW